METLFRNEASSMTSEEGESKGKWLADAKRFNAQKLRIRMKEQKLRFQNTPDDKENNVHHGGAMDESSSRPRLAIAVSMSEDAGEPATATTPRESPFVNIQAMMEGESLDFGNASAWAMMENYDMGSKATTPDKTISESPIIKDASTFWDDDKSFTTTTNPRSLPFSPDMRSLATPSTITRATTTQQIFVPHNRVEDDETVPSRGQSPNWNTSEQSTDERRTGHLLTTDPTPAKLQRLWIREKENDSCSQSPQVSLLQESLILSESAAQDNTTIYTIPSVASEDDDSTTQRSKVSRHPPGSFSTAIVPSNETRFAQMRPSALVIQPRRDEPETYDPLRLKERVVELEQALRSTIATPRGTTMQENPIKTLLDRNQTLVKEVRFADSTCVELSGKVAALEAEKKILKERVTSLEDENKELRRDFSQVMMETASLARTQDDRVSVTSVMRMGQDEEGFLRDVVEELKAEVAAWAQEQPLPVASSTSTLLSDIDVNLSTNDMDVSHTLTKALQAQVDLVKEQKLVTRKVEIINKELLTVKARNAELETQLEQERSKEASGVEPSLLMDLSRAEEESNFLGRQLGNVQDKLDQTRLELDDERKKSMAIDTKWRNQTALHLQTIRSLEAKLETASQSLAYTNRSTASAHSRGGLDSQVIKVEDDILNARTTLMAFKRGLETLLSTTVYDSKRKDLPESDAQLFSIVATFAERMRKQYSTMTSQVDKTISQYCDRLDHLTETVAFLRSSLLFETSSVSTTTSPAHPQVDVTSLASSPSKSHEREELEFQDDEEDNDEDDMYSRMEEARDNFPAHSRHFDEVSTDFDDLSRLLSDDSTLESMLKSGAAEKSVLEYENLKKPLESAIRECQRVRERSVALKEELQTEKLAFVQLESENRRLVRESSQKEEERQLVKGALGEAKTKIELLESCLSDEKSRNEEERLAFERKIEDLEQEKVHLEEWLHNTTTSKDEALHRVGSLQSHLDVTRDELQMAQSSLAETKEALASLKTRLGEVEGRAFEAEDLVLESRLSQEDMRKQRAQLKAQIAKMENQAQLLRENLERANNTSHKQLDEMSRTIKGLHVQQQESRKIIERLVNIYRNICDLFDGSENAKIASHIDGGDNSPFGINWALLEQITPFISSTLTDIHAKQSELDSLVGELTGLQNDFMRSTELGLQYQSQIEEEKAQNQKLFELLQQAELEMERSAAQIRELSVALSKQHETETEMLSKTQEAEHKRDTVLSDISELRRELSAEQRQSKQKINELTHEISTRRNTEEDLRNAVETLESKSVRLRQYVKKLTIKCEEWETSYEQQSKSLEKLQLKNARMKEKVLEMAAKYKDLSGRVKSKNRAQSENREKLAGERIDLQQIHARLEKELETITNELTAIEQK